MVTLMLPSAPFFQRTLITPVSSASMSRASVAV